MLRDDRSDPLIKVEAGGISLPPALDHMCGFFRLARPDDRWFVIHEVLERQAKHLKTKEIYFIGTLIGTEGWHSGILRSFGNAYSCTLGKPSMIGGMVVSWPEDWRTLEGYRAPTPGMMHLSRRAAIVLDDIKVKPSKPIDKQPGWRRFPYPGFVEFPRGAEAQLLLAVDLIERRGFGVYFKKDEVPTVQRLPWTV